MSDKEIPKRIDVAWVHVAASSDEDLRPRWDVYLSEDAKKLTHQGYSLDEKMAWQLLRTLTVFLQDYYSPRHTNTK